MSDRFFAKAVGFVVCNRIRATRQHYTGNVLRVKETENTGVNLETALESPFRGPFKWTLARH